MSTNIKVEEGKSLVLDFEKRGGLIPVVAQDVNSGHILMLAYINEEAFEKTLHTKVATFYSTSRKCIWTKGETSGNRLLIREIKVDCDQDAVVYLVELENGGACHTKNMNEEARLSCFYRTYNFKSGKLEFTEQ